MTKAAVALAVIRAVEQRDAEALFELYHDDVELHEAPSLPYAYTARGKPALREQLETAPETTWLGTWGPLQPTEEERRMDARVIATSGDEVTVRYTTRPSGRWRALRVTRPGPLRGARREARSGTDVPLRHRRDPGLPQAGHQR